MLPKVVAEMVDRYEALIELGMNEVNAVLQTLDELEMIYTIEADDYELFLEAINM